MKKRLKLFTKEKNRIEEQALASIREIKIFKDCYLKQIEDNPFLKRKWDWLDKILFRIRLGYIPKTPYQQQIDKVNLNTINSCRTVQQWKKASIEALNSWYKSNPTNKE